MKKIKKEVMSVSRAEQIFKQMSIPKEIYKNWNISQIFNFAEILEELYLAERKEFKIDIKDLI